MIANILRIVAVVLGVLCLIGIVGNCAYACNVLEGEVEVGGIVGTVLFGVVAGILYLISFRFD